nr:hypothetical protein [Thermoleophilaceae bacterium]
LLNVPGGPILDIARQAPGFRDLVAAELKNRTPNLLNGGREGFTESTPRYVEPPVTRPARGAVPIQDVGATSNWLNRPGSPEAFAPLLRLRPAPGVPAKRVAYQIAFGDKTVPNPTSATLLRAGKLFDVTTVYRNDRTPTASRNPHGFLLDPTVAGRNLGQRQVVEFLASEGASIVDPDGGANVFETPVADPSTLETLNFELAPANEPPPEAAVPGLRLSVAPGRVRAGRRVLVSFRVTTVRRGRRRAVKSAVVRLAGRQVRTNSRGRASVRVRFRRRGAREVVAKRRGLRAARETLSVLRAQ